jgi:hypothetical protein
MPEFGCQEIQLVACRMAAHHTGLRVLAEHTSTTAGRPLAVLAASRLSELCLEVCMNVFGREALLAEKPNDNSLIVLDPLNENP